MLGGCLILPDRDLEESNEGLTQLPPSCRQAVAKVAKLPSLRCCCHAFTKAMMSVRPETLAEFFPISPVRT